MRIFFFALILFGLGACNFNRPKGLQDSGRDPSQKGQDLGPIDFATVYSTVIGPKCVSCHSAAGGNGGGANLETFANVKALITRVQYRALIKKDMPPVSLSRSESNVLAAWIEQGAPENIDPLNPKPSVPGDTGELPNFALVKEKVFQARCLGCHSGPLPDDDLDLSDYATVKTKASRVFHRIFVAADMPVPPLPPLTAAERKILLKWFDLGMPE